MTLRPEEKLKYGCELRPCWIGSTCEDRDGSFVCHCSANTYGEFCEKSSLTNTDPCSSKPCYNYGTCIKQDQNSYTCACNGSYGGLGCRQNLVGACASNPCQRDGICVPIGLTDYRCQCPEWTIGKNCEVVFNPCQRVNCMNNGICLKRRTLAFECNCTADFTGLLCDQPKSQTCQTKACAYGQCILNQSGQFQCACITSGYEGPFCEVEKCNPRCKYGVCKRDPNGNYYCECASSYSGPSCNSLVCFSGDTLVATRDRGTVKISDLKRGDYIKTFDRSGNEWKYSRFVTYLHENRNIIASYIKLTTSSNRTLTVSPLHFIARVKQGSEKIEFVFAKHLKLNDLLITEKKESNSPFEFDRLVQKEEVMEAGAFAPLTETGTVYVNSILASCYANTVVNDLAHYVFKPIIFLSKYINVDYFKYFTSDYTREQSSNDESTGIFWYCKLFLNLLPYIPFSSYIVSF
ncbi:Neurogenic locus Notch [Brachionus plicatilis]|uniref:Neurogenic locus Notch n=1 Tax=Brachionus plicatilis TaxID=10195 RepID=A0A3M7PJ10_BRAPC|nr:Neurogenic locus Notch [Brachionus plicatilis]